MHKFSELKVYERKPTIKLTRISKNVISEALLGHLFIMSRHTSFGLDTQSRNLGALRPMHHLVAPIEAVQLVIDSLILVDVYE